MVKRGQWLMLFFLGNVFIGSLTACNTLPTDAVAEAPAELPTISLPGTSWQVVQLEESTVPGRPLTIAFSEQDRSHGYAGCNRFFAQYESRDGQLLITNIGSTRMACDEARNAIEQRFLRGLDRANRVATAPSRRPGEERLQLLDPLGAVVMELQPLRPAP